MEYTSELCDYRASHLHKGNALANRPQAVTTDRFGKIAALAYARWEALRGGAELPSIPRDRLEETRLFTPNCVQVAWDKDISTPTIPYLGSDLAGQLANLSGNAWPNLPIESPLVVLLHDISARAIRERDALEFEEQVTDSEGWIRDYQGLALPFADSESGTFLVDVLFDLDNPIPTTAAPEPDDILLLEQEIDPDEMPRPAVVPSPPPVLFVCVSDDQRTPRPAPRQEAPRAVTHGQVQALNWKSISATEISPSIPVQEEALLLTELLEPETVAEPIRRPMPVASGQLLHSLEVARDRAAAASGSEERSHIALYKAIGAAYDFARLATDNPDGLEQIIVEAGLKVQARAPMTPVVKLVFGADYDRSRLAEYASALSYAFRVDVPTGSFADYLMTVDGGLKGVLNAERQFRRKSEPPMKSQMARIQKKLRKAPVHAFDDFEPEGQEFALVITRRMPDGGLVLVGEVPPDERLFCSVARKFLKK